MITNPLIALEDAEREVLIEHRRTLMLAATDDETRRRHWTRLAQLVRDRSPAMQRYMQIHGERGLSPRV